MIQQVLSRGQQVSVRNITVKDSSDEISVALWREMAGESINAGDYISLKGVAVSAFNNEVILASNYNTKMEVSATYLTCGCYFDFFLILLNVLRPLFCALTLG